MATSRPLSREDFEIAIICALPLEYDAIALVFDQVWDGDGDQYGRASGDHNTYKTGRIGRHDVVLALLPQMGKTNAAGAAAGVRSSYRSVTLALLVGICGGVPITNEDEQIFLGDVIISKAIVQYDFGRQYPDRFVRKNAVEDNLTKPNKNIGGLLQVFKTEHGLDSLEQDAAQFLKELQGRAKSPQKYRYLGMGEDKLFESSYRHKHRESPACDCRNCYSDSDHVCKDAINSSCDDLRCEDKNLVRRDTKSHDHIIHIGSIASADTVMMSAVVRDDIAQREGIIAFEMEGAGVWDQVPCIVVKGVCDYADCHKNSKWQNFAAATAASASKAILKQYIQTDKIGLKNIITEDRG
jgi:nucleoside phosphorylase